MDLRSGRRVGSRPPLQRRGPSRRRGPGGADRISFLSDDMILLILERLRCVRTAARTDLLSRRWRGLWTRLTDLAFRGVVPATIEAALSRFNAASPAGTAFQLDIRLPLRPEAADANSLLRAASLFSPAGLVFTIEPYIFNPKQHSIINTIKLPCFQHATSMELDTQQFTVEPPAAGEFPALERLSISGTILHIGALVTRCPRLRVLRVKLHGHGFHLLERELGTLKDALSLRREVAVSMDIRIYDSDISLFSELADLSPQELVYSNTSFWGTDLDLPYFHRTTSIEINLPHTSFTPPLHGEFPALQRLCLLGCDMVDLGRFVSCCPRLRVLRADGKTSGRHIKVHSTSLEELVLGTYKDCRGIDIATPRLKKLKMQVHAGGELATSVLAPLAEEVSWRRSYTFPTVVFGFWLLRRLSLQTVASNGDGEDDAWLSVQQLPRAHVLSMAMRAAGTSYAKIDFAREMEKLSVTKFSVVDIRLQAMGHAYGTTLFHLLLALSIYSVTKILKVNLEGSAMKSEVTQSCTENCFCDEPDNWRSQNISLHYLEEVQIRGFKGENHDFDFLELISRCAPKLKKVTIKLGNKTKSFAPGSCAKKIYCISLAYPSVDFYVNLSCGRIVLRPRLPCS